MVTIKISKSSIWNKYFDNKKAIKGCRKFFSEVKINAVLKCSCSLKLASPNPKEIKTDGRAILENGSNKLEIAFGGEIFEKFKKIPINIPNNTIFFIKPNIVLTMIKM